MIRRSLGGAIMAVLISAGPANASIDVQPSPIEPQVKISGQRVHWNDSSGPEGAQDASTERAAEPTYAPIRTCRVDAEIGLYGCRTYEPGDDEPEGRDLTEGDILNAVQEIGLPSLAVRIEPGDSTLVNARTNFFTDPRAFAQSVDLLGFDVDLQASPIRYQWVHGDGTRRSTTTPGRPYPDLQVTHRYRQPGDVRPRVDVVYRVRYRVDGGAWATIGQTLTAPGPAADLEVDEAAPVLTAP